MIKKDKIVVSNLAKTDGSKLRVSEEEVNLLRPLALKDYIGQEKAKDQVRLMLDAAKKRNSALDHMLIHGGPGLGKTTLAGIMSREMAAQLKVTAGPALEKQGDLASLLSSLQSGDILFIDEIHRLKPAIEEILYGAMEDFVLDLMIGKGPTAKSMRINIPNFTLIGATTKPNMLSSPLRDRFGSVIKLDYYDDNDIALIIERSAKILKLGLDKEAAKKLSLCSRKTPRVANRLLKRLADYCLVNCIDTATVDSVNATLEIIGVDELGLDRLDLDVMNVILQRYNGGPVGLSSLAATMQEDKDTIAEIVEPYLMQIGFLQRTHRGRIVTDAGVKYINKN